MQGSSKTSANPASSAIDLPWRLADVIDFEFILEHDREVSAADLESRDQAIAQRLAAVHPAVANNRRRFFRGWLEWRRAETADGPLPGRPAMAAWALLLKLIAVAAVLLGGATAFNLLRYNGTQPVNVAMYLGWLVLAQIGLILLAILAAALRKIGWLSVEESLLTGFVRWSWSTLAIRLNRHVLDRVPAGKRQAIASFFGSAAVFQQLYGGVALWPLVGALQWFGICFNLAAIVTTIALIVFSDRAFGWQSAVNFTADQVHQLTQMLAAPWSWAIPSAAAPTLEQIAGSKIILKDGIRRLATENLVAWWPFLVAALAVYGLLPRVLLGTLSFVLGRRALATLQFDRVACDRLHERLTAHRVQSQALGPEASDERAPDLPSARTGQEPAFESFGAAPAEAVVLMSHDLRRQWDEPAFVTQLRSRLNLRPAAWLEWSDSTVKRGTALESLASLAVTDPPARIVLVEEAWQPPIAEKLNGLQDLRKSVGPKVKLIVVLVGRPEGGRFLTPTKPADLRVWQERGQALADAQLRVEALVPLPQRVPG
jgi:hypothetical protein